MKAQSLQHVPDTVQTIVVVRTLLRIRRNEDLHVRRHSVRATGSVQQRRGVCDKNGCLVRGVRIFTHAANALAGRENAIA